jgi:hypothetical protein
LIFLVGSKVDLHEFEEVNVKKAAEFAKRVNA